MSFTLTFDLLTSWSIHATGLLRNTVGYRAYASTEFGVDSSQFTHTHTDTQTHTHMLLITLPYLSATADVAN